jgi:GntR family transcriptional regulator
VPRNVVDHYSSELLHDQLAAIIRAQIRAGDLKSRDWLPSASQLMLTHDLSRGTVVRALGLLMDEGLVGSVKGRGYFVI